MEKNNLQTIEIANNKIADLSGDFFCKQTKFILSVPTCDLIPGLEHMNNLEEFWANNNSVEDFKEVGFLVEVKVIFFVFKVSKLTPNSSLLTVYLEHNPIQVSKDVGAEDSILQRYLGFCPFVFNKRIAAF